MTALLHASLKRNGVNLEDLNLLARAVHAGKSWEEAKALLPTVEEAALERRHDEVLELAARIGKPRLPATSNRTAGR